MVAIGFTLAAAVMLCRLIAVGKGRPAALAHLRSLPKVRSIAGWSAAIGLSAVALAGPRWGTDAQPVLTSERTVWLCLDVSRSMLASDVPGNRCERGKELLLGLVDALAGTRVGVVAFATGKVDLSPPYKSLAGARIGVVAFAGDAQVVCPLSRDLAHVRAVIRDLSIDSAPPGGSNFAAAVGKIARSAQPDATAHRLLVLVSDGTESSISDSPNNQTLNASGQGSKIADLAREARRANVAILTVGVGDPNVASTIEIGAGEGALAEAGKLVRSRLSEAPLRELAAGTGGLYVPARTHPADLAAIFRERMLPRIDSLESQANQSVPAQRYQWFLLPAVLLALLA